MSAPCLASCGRNVAKYTTSAARKTTRDRCKAGRRAPVNIAAVPPHSDGFVGGWAGWHVALARFCWISCMVGAVVLSTAPARTQGRPLTACRFELSGTGSVRAIIDGRSFILEDGREIRLAGIEVPLAPASGESRPRAAAALAARAALESMLASQSVELRQNGAVADRYGRALAMVYVMRDGVARSVTHEMLARDSPAFRPTSAIGLAPRSFWRRNGRRAAPNLASGANRIMSSWRPRAGLILRPNAAVSPWRRGTCCRSARAQARST